MFKMQSRNIAVSIVFFLVVSGVFARGEQELVPSGSWVYDSLAAISIESGKANFSDNSPLTIQEMKLYLSEIDYGMLSQAGKKQYDRINKYFEEKGFSLDSSLLSLSFEPSINPEGYYKSNDNIDWVYDRYERNAIVDIPMTLTVSDYASLKMDLSLGINKNTMLEDDTYVNIPLAANDFDINFPDTGYMSTGHRFTDDCGASFMIGSGQRSIGRTFTGSVIYSDNLTGANQAMLSVYSPNIRYAASVTQLGTYSSISYNTVDGAKYANNGYVDDSIASSGCYLYMHQFDFRFFEKFTFSAVEGLLVFNPLELRYLNPFSIYHGLSAWRDYGSNESNTCDYLGLKFSYVPTRNLRLYGLFAMTQYQTPYETSNYADDVTPNGLGGQMGLESYIPYGDGYFHIGLEGYYADPYLYIKEGKEWSMLRYYRENLGDTHHIFYEWVGSPFGPDTIAGELSVGYEILGTWSVDLIYLCMAQGENAGLNAFTKSSWVYPTTTEEAAASTPSGIAQYTNRISIKAQIQPSDMLSFTAQPSYVFLKNTDHVEGEKSHGFEFAFAMKINLASTSI